MDMGGISKIEPQTSNFECLAGVKSFGIHCGVIVIYLAKYTQSVAFALWVDLAPSFGNEPKTALRRTEGLLIRI
ncbi:MAG: hypothetical protein ACI8Z5_001650 [Lentimonas sp.]|jgi:hypothetical protein